MTRPVSALQSKLLLFCGSLLLALGLCEGTVRLFRLVPPVHAIWMDDEASPYRRSMDPVRSHELKPGFRKNLAAGPTSTNTHGFRDVERSIEKPAQVRRVIVLGDSVVEGISYVADNDTLTRQLETLFPDGKTEVLNFGTAGYSTLAEVTLLRDKGLAFSPDDVVLVFTDNDYFNFTSEHTTEGGHFERPRWAQHLFLSSHFFRLLCLRLNWFQFAEEADPIAWNRKAVGENNVVDGMRILRVLANKHDFRVIVAVWPVFNDSEIYDVHAMPGKEELIIERLANMNGLPVTRLAAPFQRHWKSTEPEVDPSKRYTAHGDGMHPSAEGGRVAALLLKDALSSVPAPPYRASSVDEDAVQAARSLGANVSESMLPMEERMLRALHRQNRSKDSADFLRNQVESQPESFFARFHFGQSLLESKQVDQAIPHLLKARELDPNHAEVYSHLALAYSLKGDMNAALKILREGVEQLPRNARLHFDLAYGYAKINDWPASESQLEKVIELDPEFPDAETLLERVRAKLSGARN